MRLKTAVLSCFLMAFCAAPLAWARHKAENFSSGSTGQLYALLNESFGGRLSNFYILADQYPDPKNPKSQLQHVLSVTYNKSLFFGRFVIKVRSIGKPTADQLKTYTPKQLFGFGETDSQEFEKIQPGPFGSAGDLYLREDDGGSLASAPITDEVRDAYNRFVTQYILPSLQKKESDSASQASSPRG